MKSHALDIEHDWLIDVLPYIRIILGESRESFAEKLGVTTRTYYLIENRKTKLSVLFYHAISNLIKQLSTSEYLIWSPIVYLYDEKDTLIKRNIIKLIDDTKKYYPHIHTKTRQKRVLRAYWDLIEEHGADALFEHDIDELIRKNSNPHNEGC